MVFCAGNPIVKAVDLRGTSESIGEMVRGTGESIERFAHKRGGATRLEGRQQHAVGIAMFVGAQLFVDTSEGGMRYRAVAIHAATPTK
ncbi:MAG: hypothetical protein JWP63_6341 [Candidatus Solibacter sp.]|nr:hypothetical protein [Candidatus Solibacter sp.]